jgi:DNA-binding beta-propeller fold protein YncE
MKLTHGLLLFATSCASVSLVQGDSLDIRPLATVALSGAEISDFDPASDRLFVTASSGLQIIDLANPATPAVVTTLNLTAAPYNLPVTDVTSVAVHNGVVAVALPAADKANPGTVVFLNAADGTLLGTATVGSLPDNIAFTPDGSKVLTAVIKNTSPARYLLRVRSPQALYTSTDIVMVPPHGEAQIQVTGGVTPPNLSLDFEILNTLVAPRQPLVLNLKPKAP